MDVLVHRSYHLYLVSARQELTTGAVVLADLKVYCINGASKSHRLSTNRMSFQQKKKRSLSLFQPLEARYSERYRHSIKHGVHLSALQKERVGGDSYGISYWYDDDPISGTSIVRRD